jgi:hypothetical protein
MSRTNNSIMGERNDQAHDRQVQMTGAVISQRRMQSTTPIAYVPIVPGATANDNPISGDTYILVSNESLCFGNELDQTLINPNQLRSYGIRSYAFTVNRGQLDAAQFAPRFWYSR